MKNDNIDFLTERKPENYFCYLKHCTEYAYDSQLGTEFSRKKYKENHFTDRVKSCVDFTGM